MKFQIISIIIIFTVTFISCRSKKEISASDLFAPPGTVKMAENLFVDQSEITNINYLEFVHWTGRVFGKESDEYRKVLPNTSIWNELGKHYKSFIDHYFKHPVYRNAPVVGISYEQAKLFCKWRSDRVMEFFLIREGVIKHNRNPGKDSCFSIENYFTGHYGEVCSHPLCRYYPEYSLPDSITFEKALAFADSLNIKFVKKEKWKEMFQVRCFENIPDKNDTLLFGLNPVKTLSWPGGKMVVNLKGNVRELTEDKNWTFGGSFKDSCKIVNKQNFYFNTGPNFYTGFRSVCRFKKWED